MSAAEKRDDDKIELPLERFERLLRALETSREALKAQKKKGG